MMSLTGISIPTFIGELRKKLQYELKGEVAHMRMIPRGRRLYPNENDNPRKSAVLIALYYNQGELYFPLIKRPVYSGIHSGQMALPGGKFEREDKNLINTALREAFEEVGIQSDEVEVIGTLSEIYISVTNISVLPVVGFLRNKPEYHVSPTEVDHLFKIKLTDILSEQNQAGEVWNIHDQDIFVPYYKLAGQKVWGATAMILSELELLLKS